MGGGGGSLSEFVCSNTFCTFGPKLRTTDQGGGQNYTFLKRSLHWESKTFNRSYKRKVIVEAV